LKSTGSKTTSPENFKKQVELGRSELGHNLVVKAACAGVRVYDQYAVLVAGSPALGVHGWPSDYRPQAWIFLANLEPNDNGLVVHEAIFGGQVGPGVEEINNLRFRLNDTVDVRMRFGDSLLSKVLEFSMSTASTVPGLNPDLGVESVLPTYNDVKSGKYVI